MLFLLTYVNSASLLICFTLLRFMRLEPHVIHEAESPLTVRFSGQNNYSKLFSRLAFRRVKNCLE